MRSLECYFGVYFPCCCATREINTKITLSWAPKQFSTRVHTLFYIYILGLFSWHQGKKDFKRSNHSALMLIIACHMSATLTEVKKFIRQTNICNAEARPHLFNTNKSVIMKSALEHTDDRGIDTRVHNVISIDVKALYSTFFSLEAVRVQHVVISVIIIVVISIVIIVVIGIIIIVVISIVIIVVIWIVITAVISLVIVVVISLVMIVVISINVCTVYPTVLLYFVWLGILTRISRFIW